MAGTKEINSNLIVQGNITVATVPNSTGTFVTYNLSTKILGTRSNVDMLNDLGLTTIVSDSHTHTNKTVLDGITAINVTNWNTGYNYSQIGHLPLTGGSLTGPVSLSGTSTTMITRTIPNTSGGWSRSMYGLKDAEGTLLNNFGYYGSGATYTYSYIGSTYSDSIIRFYADKRVMINNLSGTGDRIVTANSTGILSATNKISDFATVQNLNNKANIDGSNISPTIWSNLTSGNSTNWNGVGLDWTTGNNAAPTAAIIWDNTIGKFVPTDKTQTQAWLEIDPGLKVNSMENARGLGFEFGVPEGRPYIFHTGGAYVFLATSNWVGNNYVNRSGDSMTNSLQIFKPIQSDVYNGNLQIKTNDVYTSVSHGIGDVSMNYLAFLQSYSRNNNNASHYLMNPVGGNVGIGINSNPVERLHILGNIYNQGNENNHIRTITDASGINQIVAGHEYRWYDTYWKIGNQRGDTVNSISFSFEFNGNRVAMIDPSGTIYARNGNQGNSEQWNMGYTNGILRDGLVGINNGSNTRINKVWFDYSWAGLGRAGSVISFGGFGGAYQTELFSDYSNGNYIGMRTFNGDVQQWNPVRELIHSGNIDQFTGSSIFTQTPQGGIKTNIWTSSALSQYSVAIGHLTSAKGLGNTQIGFGQNGNGAGSTSIGYMSNIIGDFSTNVGIYNGSTKGKSTFVGLGLTNTQEGITIIGRYNEPTSSIGYDDDTANSKKEVLILAAGVDDDNRKNVFTTTADDRTKVIDGIYYDTQNRDQIDFTPTTLIDRRYFEENSGNGSSILQNYTFQDANIDNVYNGEVIEGLSASGTVNQSLGELIFAAKHVSSGGFYHAINNINIYGQLLCFSSTTLVYSTTLLKGHINVNNNMIATHDVINKPHVYLLSSAKGIEIINTDANTIRYIMTQAFAGTYTNIIRLGTFLTVGTNELLFYFDPTIII